MRRPGALPFRRHLKAGGRPGRQVLEKRGEFNRMVPVTHWLHSEGESRLRKNAAAAPVERADSPRATWHVTRTCNLNCLRCNTDSSSHKFPGELSTEEGDQLIRELARFKVPNLVFSGGEPLMRRDIFRLAKAAHKNKLSTELESNGTLITKELARKIREAGFSQITVSLDGVGSINDFIRGRPGAFRRAVQGLKNLRAAGVRTGLCFTLTRQNLKELPKMVDFAAKEGIAFLNFRHLVYTGRGVVLKESELTYREKREVLAQIFSHAWKLAEKDAPLEISTTEHAADRVFLMLWAEKNCPAAVARIADRLNREDHALGISGIRTGNIDFTGAVHPDRFWLHYTLGNVKEKKFSDIWTDASDPLMEALKDRKRYLKGRCSACRWVSICLGSVRVRADIVFDDPLAPDPACYLSDDEIGCFERERQRLREKGENFDPPPSFTQ
jgi:radical SAM protein with 4Fe4S-binding SPASM domain